jgi:hypothetical protein
MKPDTAVLNAEQEALLTQLAQSRARVLALAREGKIDATKLRQVAEDEASLTTRLKPLPDDPREQVLAAYAYVRPYLERLTRHDPARLVVARENTHSYTPRKILRRVLDHALDHLNQIEQWLAWQQHGTMPTPTDGWASSADTFPEDLQPLSAEELQAWLWRIDLTIGLLARRAGQLSAVQLDWMPPDGGWTLRKALRHVSQTSIYYSIWLDEPLPDEPVARYSEASRRLEQQLRRVFALPANERAGFFTGDGMLTAEQIAQKALEEEQTLLTD